MWIKLLIIPLLASCAFGQQVDTVIIGESQIDDWAIDSSSVQHDAIADPAITWDDIWIAQDDPKPKCPDFVEIFYTDTVGWYLDTTTVQVSCPDPYYSMGCGVMHWDDKIEWKPKVETISIFKFEPSTFEHFERWRIKKQ